MVRRSPGPAAIRIAAPLVVLLVAVPALLGTRVPCSVWRAIALTCVGIAAVAGFLGSLVWIAAIGTGLALMLWVLVTRPPAADDVPVPA